MKVFKFGGASVKDAASIKNVAGILSQFANEQVLVVVSAMGKMTNLMENLVHAYFYNNNNTSSILAEIRQFHYQILQELDDSSKMQLYNDVDNLLLELECMVENPNNLEDYDFVYDQIVCFGELLSTRIVSNYLVTQQTRNQWIDARNFIITDNCYRDGKIDWAKTEHIIANRLRPVAEKSLVITQGFIGRDSVNATTTLGREGSDYSAAVFAYCLNAESVTIWKDVAGVMNADPRKFPFATLIPELTYNDSIELAYYGASVIHPKTIQPLRAKNIPLFVRSFMDMDAAGTVVSNTAKSLDVACYIHKAPQVLFELSSRDFNFIVEDTLRGIFAMLAENKMRCGIMQNSAISFSFVTDVSETRIAKIKGQFENAGLNCKITEGVELLTVYNGVLAQTEKLTAGKQIYMQQSTGNTVHFVLG
ncbi:MAG: aspartate kinase [Bacteroidia bacterium]|nr:aspartate kinase [Bacteroidia bacterium]